MRVLLTGARAPVTLDLARQFHRAGHEVYLADSIQQPLSRPTRAARQTFLVAPPAVSPSRFVEDLVAIVRRCRIELMIPTCEEIYYIGARRAAFEGLTRVFAEPLSKLEPLHNKWSFVQQVIALGGRAQAPESQLLRDAGKVAEWLDRHEPREWVLKLIYSRFAARTLIGPPRSAVAKLRPEAGNPWLAQRRIVGQEYSTYSVACEGRLRAHACYRSEYRAGPGSGIYFVAVRHPGIREFIEQLVARLEFTGQIGFDFIDGTEGAVSVLECNPRATSGLHLLESTPLADVFLPEWPGEVLEPTTSEPAMLGSIMLLYAFPQALRGGGLKPLVRDLWRARDVLFSRSDPWPALLAPLSLVEVMWRACRTRQPLTRAATWDIEWNGEPM